MKTPKCVLCGEKLEPLVCEYTGVYFIEHECGMYYKNDTSYAFDIKTKG